MKSKPTILIADDSVINQQILTDILGEEYEYLYADNGMHALELLGSSTDIDLLLLDINMPQLDGFGVLDGENKRLLVTIGQFSIARLERSTQLLIPTFDYCVPTKSCPNVGSSSSESPCEVFGQIEFPMDAFFPTKADSCIPAKDSCTNCSRTAK